VKCTVQFKGREVQHDNLGFDLLNRMAEDMTKICTMEGKPKREGRNLSCILSPRPEVTKAVNDKKRASDKEKKKMKLQSKDKKPVKGAALGDTNGLQEKEKVVDDGDDDDDEDISLDELLGSNTSTDELFK
jgi:Translation initiation factor 3 (IF-3)